MRLIDADELKAKMFDIPKPKEGVTFWDGVDTVGDLIDNAQTVEQEVYMNSKDFERPKNQGITVQNTRTDYSQTYYNSHAGKKPQTQRAAFLILDQAYRENNQPSPE